MGRIILADIVRGQIVDLFGMLLVAWSCTSYKLNRKGLIGCTASGVATNVEKNLTPTRSTCVVGKESLK